MDVLVERMSVGTVEAPSIDIKQVVFDEERKRGVSDLVLKRRPSGNAESDRAHWQKGEDIQ